jgi:hypothetical protein
MRRTTCRQLWPAKWVAWRARLERDMAWRAGLEDRKNSSPLEGLEPLEDARVGGEKAGGFTAGRPLWPGLNTCLSSSSHCSTGQPLCTTVAAVAAAAAASAQSRPPHASPHTAPRQVRARPRKRPSEVLSSAGLDGRLDLSVAWRAGGRSCPAAAERSTQSARRRGAPKA